MNGVQRMGGWMLALALSACGGGGSGCDAQVALGGAVQCSNSGGNATLNYTAVATPGELVSFSFTPATGLLAYTLTDSLYNLANQSRQFVLSRNPADNTYSNTNYAGKFAFNDGGLMMGLVQENFGSGVIPAPALGLQSPEKDLAQVADIYNMVTTQCTALNVCSSNHGTVQFNPNNTWRWCVGDDLSQASPSCATSASGLLTQDAGSGKWTLKLNNLSPVATALIQVRNGQKVLLLDLIDQSSTLKTGMAVGVAQANAPTSLDGTWRYMDAMETGKLIVSGTQVTRYVDVTSGYTRFTVAGNTPWSGLATVSSASGVIGVAVMSDAGIMALIDTSSVPNGFIVGLKQ